MSAIIIAVSCPLFIAIFDGFFLYGCRAKDANTCHFCCGLRTDSDLFFSGYARYFCSFKLNKSFASSKLPDSNRRVDSRRS